MKFFKYLVIASILITMCGCSTLNNKTLLYGAVGFIGCSVIGATNAPKDESTAMHGAAFGSMCAAGAMAAKEIYDSVTYKKDKERMSQLRSEEVLKEKDIRMSLLDSDAYDSLDESIKESLTGKWKIYETKNWIYDGEKMIREDVHVEFESEKD